MSDQVQIQLMKEYIAYLEKRLMHSDMMHDHAMEMVRKLMEKLK
jgi:hypothetical protein